VVGEQLERRCDDHGCEQLGDARDEQDAVGVLGDRLVPLARDRDHPRSASADLLDVRQDLGVDVALGRDRDHRHTVLDERDRPVLELAGGIALGVNVRELLQLEGALQRGRIAGVTSDEQYIAGIADLLGDPSDLLGQRERSAHLARQLAHATHDVADLDREHRAADLCEV
jgi:hypothetical protein